MRRTEKLMEDWTFSKEGERCRVELPHTWNAQDGQDGGNDYYRGVCVYERQVARPALYGAERVYLQFEGVNASARVLWNGACVCTHDNGYAAFRVDITDKLREMNTLTVEVDNGKNRRVYPQAADFTFYGGIYRDVALLIVPEVHFDLDYYGGNGLRVTTEVQGTTGRLHIRAYTNRKGLQAEGIEAVFTLRDAQGVVVISALGHCAQGHSTKGHNAQGRSAKGHNAQGCRAKGHNAQGRSAKGHNAQGCRAEEFRAVMEVADAHLWNGVKDPYLYQLEARLMRGETVVDEISVACGIRTFFVDADKGFFLNGASYPLRGVSRHQDYKGIGNAISKAQMDEDMALIREVGANTIRLAHYQHSSYFYDLCDRYGMVVWAEIPYISEHMPEGRENTFLQLRELIVQNFNHPCIVTWGLSNEITISGRNRADMLDNHRKLQRLAKRLDPTRPTTLACYAMCHPFHPVTRISDLVAWNLYLGWYVPGLFLNDRFMEFYHRRYPDRPLGYSEYGAEGMPNLHSARPRRGDHSEEYQARYHEYMLECFDRHPFLWATYVWNMFDFAADARDQGGEAGMNHKGLVTFDRRVKKDSFYIYKAWWSEEPFVHLCGKRYRYRAERTTTVTVYSNRQEVSLYCNGKRVATQRGAHVFRFRVALAKENRIEARSGGLSDRAVLYRTRRPRPEYKVKKSRSQNWT
ncbi:MAG: glycoside hydrolase family 2 protein [Roseburia sp.]|nr:glycoside hydrolase family 2 protein [Roseburia sp.]